MKNGDLTEAVKHSNEERLRRLLDRLLSMDPVRFEHLIAKLLDRIGFEQVRVTKRSGDGGIDVMAELTVGGVTRVKTSIQVKRWKDNVPPNVITQTRGSVKTDERGLVITTSEFTKAARFEADAEGKTPVSLIDGRRLVELLAQHEIAVKRKQLDYYELDLDQLEPAEIPTEVMQPKLMLRLWPIPGGKDNYVDSTIAVLDQISTNAPSKDQMVAWMRAKFPKARSEGVIEGYLLVFRTLGLVRFDGEKLHLTPEGAECLASDPQMVLGRQLRTRVAGTYEIESELKKGPLTKDEISRVLNEKLGTGWKTTAQTEWRLRWMVAAGILKEAGGKFELA